MTHAAIFYKLYKNRTGTETTRTSKNHRNPDSDSYSDLDSYQCECTLRLRISYLCHVSNAEVLRKTNQRQLSTVLCDRCLRFFGHVANSDTRMDHVRALRAVILGMPNHWKRHPGRPRQTWTRTIAKDLSMLNIGWHTAWRRAQYRECWRQYVETATLC